MLAAVQASHKRTDELVNLMDQMDDATTEAFQCCEWLNHRAKQLDALTSPASDASSMLSRANANLAATLVLMKDAREKFDTVQDCEPAMERLDKGVKDLEESGEKTKKKKSSLKNRVVLTEQDVYAAGDSIEILRDAFQYFNARSSWRSAPSTLSALERLHKMGLDAMCSLIQIHLKKAGPAVRPKRNLKKDVLPADETAQQVRKCSSCLFSLGVILLSQLHVRRANDSQMRCRTEIYSNQLESQKNINPSRRVLYARYAQSSIV